MFEINVMSGIRMTRHYPPGMVKRGWGCVIFIGSESALAIPKDMIGHDQDRAACDFQRCDRECRHSRPG
jgi:NAD(P)-dependent dehydrogenase (short-subunit alcohol dehydrogenase family)